MGLYDMFTGGPGNKPLSGIPLVGNIAGSVLGGIGAMMGANAQASGYKAQAKATEVRAKNVDLEAKNVAKVAKYESWMADLTKRQMEGKQRATYANLGLEIQDTAIENLAAMAKQITMDKLMMRRNADINIYGLKEESKALREEANQLRKTAKSTKQQGILSAIGSFL